MDTKVTTVIVNDTREILNMKVGNRNCYVRLASVQTGGEYTVQIDVNWTYQEFLMQDKAHCEKQLVISSDDCCDYDRITVTKTSDGSFDAHWKLREQFRTAVQLESDHGTHRRGAEQEKFEKAWRPSALRALEKRGADSLWPKGLPARRGRRCLPFSPLRPVALSQPDAPTTL